MTLNAITRRVRAPRAIYRALLDPQAIQAWRMPEGMRCVVHEFAPHEGGRFRVSLSYDDSAAVGKSGGHTDTYHGRFARLIPDVQVIEVLEFETEDPLLQSEMLVTTTLADAAGGTDVTVGMPAADNQPRDADGAPQARRARRARNECGDLVRQLRHRALSGGSGPSDRSAAAR